MTEAEKSDKITVKRGMGTNGFYNLTYMFYFTLFIYDFSNNMN